MGLLSLPTSVLLLVWTICAEGVSLNRTSGATAKSQISGIPTTANSSTPAGLFSTANRTSSATAKSQISGTPTTANSSIPAGSFPFIIPYGQNQECDIYGPLCQTGSITVGVNLTTATPTTTLPCSSYLTAQSSYLNKNQPGPGGLLPFYPTEWAAGFGHSPQCTSYAEVWSKGGQYTFSNCEASNKIVQSEQKLVAGSLPSQLPPGVVRKHAFDYYTCCGNCSLQIPEVRLYYFPDSAIGHCANNRSATNSSFVGNSLGKRVGSVVSTGSTAILSGHTFTSPSVYLEVVGTASASDKCGTIGSTYANPFITLAPGQLSTYVPPAFLYTVGEEYHDPQAAQEWSFFGDVKPLNIADLECPTFGLGKGTRGNGEIYTTVGPPWLPVIVPPPEALSLDPLWGLCSGILSVGPGMESFAIFDPPRTLEAGTYMAPTSPQTPAAVPAMTTKAPDPESPAKPAPAEPQRAPVDPNDSDTGSKAQDPGNAPAPAPGDPQNPPKDPKDPQAPKGQSPGDVAAPAPADPQGPRVDPNETKQAPKAPDAGNAAAPAAADPGRPQGSLHAPEFQPQSPQSTPHSANQVHAPDLPQPAAGPVDPAAKPTPAPGQPQPQPVASASEAGSQDGTSQSPQGGSPDVGALIFNAFGGAGPQAPGNGDSIVAIPIPTSGTETHTVNGQVLTIDPTKAVVNGVSHTAGGPPVTLPNGIFSFVTNAASGPNAVIGGNAAPEGKLPNGNSVITILGQSVNPNPLGMTIAGSKLVPGGSALTLSGTPVSLDPSGVLYIGSTVMPLRPQSVFTIGTNTFTADPAGFSFGGVSLTPGGPAQTVDGTAVALDRAGKLQIAGSTFNIPSPQPTSVFTLGTNIFTANPTGFPIGGTSVIPGGPTQTVDGTAIALDRAGKLQIAGSTFNILAPQPTSIFTLGTNTFTANPTGFAIGGISISPGGSAQTIDGKVVSLNQVGSLRIGSSTFNIPSPQPTSIFTLGTNIFTANPTGFAIGGTSVIPGGPAQTLDGKVVSLDQTGNLRIGSSTFDISPPQPTTIIGSNGPQASSVLTTDGLTIQPGASAIIVDGVTLKPGGPATIIDGSLVSLELGGTLDVGSERIPIPTGWLDGTANMAAFQGAQSRSFHLSQLLLLGASVISAVWTM